MKCPECDGKGKYVGLVTIEDPCENCGGDGTVGLSIEFGEVDSLPSVNSEYKAAREALEEQMYDALKVPLEVFGYDR